MAKMTSELNEADAGCSSGAKYLGVFSSRSLKMREKYISFAQFLYTVKSRVLTRVTN